MSLNSDRTVCVVFNAYPFFNVKCKNSCEVKKSARKGVKRVWNEHFKSGIELENLIEYIC